MSLELQDCWNDKITYVKSCYNKLYVKIIYLN